MTIQVREKVEPEVRVKSVPEVLRSAAHLIEEFGWISGGFGSRKKGYCLVGALTVAADGGNKDWDQCTVDGLDPYHPLRSTYIEARKALPFSEPEVWNDSHGRTAAEVTAALRAAADAYESALRRKGGANAEW